MSIEWQHIVMLAVGTCTGLFVITRVRVNEKYIKRILDILELDIENDKESDHDNDENTTPN